MYEYRKLTPEQRTELVKERLARGFPPHSPPHPMNNQVFYLLTAVNFEHAYLMTSPKRRQELLDLLFENFSFAKFSITT